MVITPPSPTAHVAAALKRAPKPREPRPLTTMGRAERGGRIVCQATLVVVRATPGTLGVEPTNDLTVWFYGALDSKFERELEDLAALDGAMPEELPEVDLVLQSPGGELRLEGCRIGAPLRYAGPANTLEYQVSHPGKPEHTSGFTAAA